MPELRQPTGTAFAIRDALAWGDLAAIVRASEAAGYAAVFLPEIGARDALVTLAALAGETTDLLLGTGVVPMRSRTPSTIEAAAATVAERSGGRLILGLGTGDAGRGALAELRSQVLALREGLAERGAPRGEAGRPSFAVPPVSIWISALGPRSARLGGEIADGVLLNWCSPERVRMARDEIAAGASSSGRDPDDVTLAVYVRAWAGNEPGADGMRALKRATGQYASYAAYARQFDRLGFGAEAEAAAAAFERGRPDDVPEALVRAVCVIGGEAADRLEAYRNAGARVPVVYPVPAGDAAASIEATLLRLAPA